MAPTARVHLGNIKANWRALDGVFSSAETGAVVKADAYGLGASPVVETLADAGCRTFFVAYGDEGYDVRIAAGPEAVIYAFNGLVSGNDVNWGPDGVRPVVNSLDELGQWLGEAAGDAPFALMVDTGMNRLGVRFGEVGAALSMLGDRQPALVMSHLSSADEPGSGETGRQEALFREIARGFEGVPLSLTNSAGHQAGLEYGFDLGRPGLALYGGGPAPEGVVLAPGVTVEAAILRVQDVPAGETVGYGATHIFHAPARIATVSMGYADGLPRSLSNRGFVCFEGARCPIIGRVSMDLITVDVTAIDPPGGDGGLAKVGARVEVIGGHARLDEQAERAGTLGYELLTGLGRRVERIYEP
ncbi:MAG: alanine racemase [Pseudomonadota bacterium]